MIANQQYEPAGFKMTLALNDVRLVLEAAECAATPMPIASVLKDSLLDAIAHGAADHDWARWPRFRRDGQDVDRQVVAATE